MGEPNFTVSTSNFHVPHALAAAGAFQASALRAGLGLRAAGRHGAATGVQFLHDQALLEYRLHGRNTILGGALRNHAEAYHVLRTYQKNGPRRGRRYRNMRLIDCITWRASFATSMRASSWSAKSWAGWSKSMRCGWSWIRPVPQRRNGKPRRKACKPRAHGG